MKKFKLGADPEVFLTDGVRTVSAYGLFPGTKKEPFKVEKGAIQVDGMALEFNIDPAETAEEFSDNIEIVKAQMYEMVKKVDPALQLKFVPVADFDQEYFKTQPLEAKILGCEPDFNHSGAMNLLPEGMQDQPIRTTAGHVHIGFQDADDPMDARHFEDCRWLASYFYIGGYFSPKTLEERRRLNYYGAAAAFRPKKYGVEIRSPSNLWVASRETQKQTFEIVKKVMHSL